MSILPTLVRPELKKRISVVCCKLLALALALGSVNLLHGCGEKLTEAQYVERARESMDKGELHNSVINLKNALQENPANAEARALLGQVYVEIGDGAAAEKQLRQALEHGMAAESVAVPLARAFLMQGKFADLLNINVDPALLNADAGAEILALKGRAYLSQNNLDEAAKAFNLALATKQDSAPGLLGQAWLSVRQRQWDEARRWNGQALAAAPALAEAWSLQGDLDYEAGNLQQAEAAYSKAIPQRMIAHDDYLKRALIRIALKNYQGAQDDVQAVAKGAPRYPGVHYVAGRIHFEQQRFADAQTAFEQELNNNANHIEALYYLGLSHLALNHPQQAEDAFKRLANLLPDSSQASKLLAEAYVRNKQFTNAEAVLQSILQRTPSDSDALSLIGRMRVAQGEAGQGIDYLKRVTRSQPDSADARLQLGISLIEKGDQEEGIRELQKAIELNPRLQAADVTLILSELRAQAFDKAQQAAARLVAKQPDEPLSHTLLGQVYQSQGQLQQARERFEQALKLNPDFAEAAVSLARLDVAAGNYAAAETRYRKILQTNSTSLEAMLGLADLARQKGDTRQVLDWLEKARGQYPDDWQVGLGLVQNSLDRNEQRNALEQATNLYKANPANPAVLRGLGLTQLANRNSSEAQSSFSRLAELQPRSPEAQYLLALTQQQANNPQAAVAALDKALSLQNNYLPALVARSTLYLQEQRFDKALADARTVQTLYPDQAVGYQLEGDSYLQQKNYTQSIAAYRKAYEKEPDSRLLQQLGNAQWLSGDREQALATLREWLQTHPQDIPVATQLADYFNQWERQAEAIGVYEQLAERAANQPESAGRQQGVTPADNLLNQTYLQRGEYDKALAAASKLSKQWPDEPGPYNLLGAAYMAKGALNEAREAFQQVLKLEPNSVPAQLNLAQLDLRVGDKNAAEQRYRQILGRDQGNPVATVKLVQLLGDRAEALPLLEKAWERQPPLNLDIGLMLAQAYLDGKQQAQALPLIKQLRAAYPSEARVVRALGLAQTATGDNASALISFQKLTQLEPQAAEPWYWVAMAQGALKNYQATDEALNKALQLQNKYLPALEAKARLQQQNNRLKEALETASRIQALYPALGNGYVLEGDIRLQQKDYANATVAYQSAYAKVPSRRLAFAVSSAQFWAGDGNAAITTLKKWLETNPADLETRKQMAEYLLSLDRRHEALQEYAQLAQKLPDDAVMFNNLAILYQKEGDQRALDHAERALQLAPDDPQIKDTLGWILVQIGQVQRGLELLQQAVTKAPGLATLRYHLAVAHDRAGRPAEARRQLEQVLKNDASFPERQAARELLDRLSKTKAQ